MARGAWIAYARIAEIGARALGKTRERLSATDRARYARFATPRRRREFLAGRWLLAASQASWARDARVGTSVSHSGGWVACALLERGVPGVDIEPMVARDFPKLGAWAFAPRDREPWPRAPRDARRAFYGRWTRYEARLKGAKNSTYGERTWFIAGVALSARLPRKIFIEGGGPQRWRQRGGFSFAKLKAGNFERR
jgi:4'-phosphopantetheinyl transferase